MKRLGILASVTMLVIQHVLKPNDASAEDRVGNH